MNVVLLVSSSASSLTMSSFNAFQIAKDMNGLLVENFAWVDVRLREMYNGYALTASNCDEYESAGILKENWSWVDCRLEEMCKPKTYALPLCPLPLKWGGFPSSNIELECIEEENCYSGQKRKRSESDTSDYDIEVEHNDKRARCQSPILKGKHLVQWSNQFCNLDCERYNYKIIKQECDTASVNSLELASIFEQCSLCDYYPTSSFNYDCDWSEAPFSSIYNKETNIVSDDESCYDCDGYDSP